MGRQCRFRTYSLGIPYVKVGGSFVTLTQNKDWFPYPLCMANSWGSWQLFLWQPYLGNLYIAKENTACLLCITVFLMAGALVLPSMACVLGHGWGRDWCENGSPSSVAPHIGKMWTDGSGWEEGHEDDQRAEACLLQIQVEKGGNVQPGEISGVPLCQPFNT